MTVKQRSRSKRLARPASQSRGRVSRTAAARRPRESLADRTTRASRILKHLHRLYPDATCALHHDSALQLLVATILSAQCTDTRVNMVTPDLFRRYPTAGDLAAADARDLERQIQSTGFFRNKTRSLIGMGQAIATKFGGNVPDTMENLIELPGVARKTANVVLGTWFHKNDGVVVDTHVGRVATRLALTWTARNEKDAVRIEQDLMQVLPRDEWTFTSHALIWHGRRICTARKPRCEACDLAPLCPSAFTFNAAARRPRDAKSGAASTRPPRSTRAS